VLKAKWESADVFDDISDHFYKLKQTRFEKQGEKVTVWAHATMSNFTFPLILRRVKHALE